MRNDTRAAAEGPPPEDPTVPPIIGYARAIRAHLRLCGLIVLASLLGAVGWMATHPAEYKASSALLITPLAPGDPSFLGVPMIRSQGADPQRAVDTAARLSESEDVLRRTSEALSDISPAAVERAVEITPGEGENIVEISATTAGRERSAEIANAYLDAVLASRQEELRPLIADAIARAETQLSSLPDREGLRATELESRLADLRSVDDGADPTLTVAGRASAPSAPEGPPRWLIPLVALIMGIAIAAATAILTELLAPGAISDLDTLRRAYPLPILAQVPRGSGRLTGSHRGPRLDSDVREAFRTLRGQLELRQADRASGGNGVGGNELAGLIAITSPSAGDGKTTAALALAQATATSGRDVIVIESDLRKPDLARYLGVEPDQDLTAVLGGDRQLSSVATPWPAASWLKFVAAPRVEDMSMIERLSAVLPSRLTEAASEESCVIVDTAALGEVSDALMVLTTADQVVVAVRLNHTTYGALATLRDAMERSGVRPAGFVVFDSHAKGYPRVPTRERGRRRQPR